MFAFGPQRHFAIVNCGIAKGSLDHLVGARDCALADFSRWIINRRRPSSLAAAELTPVTVGAGAA
jgi:hypothetical protein